MNRTRYSSLIASILYTLFIAVLPSVTALSHSPPSSPLAHFFSSSSPSPSPSHSPTAFYTPFSGQPVFDTPYANLFDRDNQTTIVDVTLGPLTPSYTATFTLNNPTQQFILFYLNQHVHDVKMKISIGAATFTATDVDQSYLTVTQQTNYQKYWSSAETHKSECAIVYPNQPCRFSLTLELVQAVDITMHLSVMIGNLLRWDVIESGRCKTGLVDTSGMYVSLLDLNVYIQLQSQSDSSNEFTDHQMYIFHADNPLQWFWPPPNFQGSGSIGAEYDYLMTDEAHRPVLGGPAPGEGGNLMADPNYTATQFQDGLYLVVAYATTNSVPQKGTGGYNWYDVRATRKFQDSTFVFNSSTYGIIGALTLLVLCLLTAGVVLLRRRCSMRHQLDDPLARFIGGQILLSRAALAQLPRVDSHGRPIQYDAYGRVIAFQGAEQEELLALPKKKYTKGMMADEDAHCTICLGDYEEGEDLKDLPCAHTFHAGCIDKWLGERKRNCPLCQQDIQKATDVRSPEPQHNEEKREGETEVKESGENQTQIAANATSAHPPASSSSSSSASSPSFLRTPPPRTPPALQQSWVTPRDGDALSSHSSRRSRDGPTQPVAPRLISPNSFSRHMDPTAHASSRPNTGNASVVRTSDVALGEYPRRSAATTAAVAEGKEREEHAHVTRALDETELITVSRTPQRPVSAHRTGNANASVGMTVHVQAADEHE